MSLGDLGSRPGVPYLKLVGSDWKSWIACWLSEPSEMRIGSRGQYITTQMHISKSAPMAKTMNTGTQLPVPLVHMAGLGYAPTTGSQSCSCPCAQPAASVSAIP